MTLLSDRPASPSAPDRSAPDLSALGVERLGPGFGAVLHDVDLAAATDEQVALVSTALTEHKVLFFRGQTLDADSQVALGRRLGEVTASHPVREGLDDAHPEIYELDSYDGGFADVWHTDVTFVARPPRASVLRAVTLPPYGGDTNWADLELAYASLSAPLQRLADELTAVHDGNEEWGYYLAQRRQGEGSLWDGEVVRRLEPVEHPVVRVHPETGRKSLFVNPGFTTHLKDLSKAESRGLLDVFFAHLTKPEHVVRH
ncbi:MAG: taurine dioxygenase, partial [Frankiales bacterium]|nr:taurine dioxygenase [Frankiales bacterium]